MKNVMLGVFAAGAVASLIASGAMAEEGKAAAGAEAKGCYRKECGKSVTGHPGKCGGTKVDDVTDQATCEKAGGGWTTAAGAEEYKH